MTSMNQPTNQPIYLTQIFQTARHQWPRPLRRPPSHCYLQWHHWWRWMGKVDTMGSGDICCFLFCKYDGMTPIWSLLKGAKFPKNNPRLTSFMETNTPRWFLVVESTIGPVFAHALFQKGNTLSRVKWTIFKLLQATLTWPLFEQANTYSHCFTIAVSESNKSLQLSIIVTCWMVDLQNFLRGWEMRTTTKAWTQ